MSPAESPPENAEASIVADPLDADDALESFCYDDDIVRRFIVATVVWGLVGMLAGLYLALELVMPVLGDVAAMSFGRLKPLHTNAMLFAFAGNAMFAAVYYSTQRLCRSRMYSDRLGRVHFWGWQGVIGLGVVTVASGATQGREFAEMAWPFDVALAALWLIFAINFFGTLTLRRERHLYVTLWFYSAALIVLTAAHVIGNLALPTGWMSSYPAYSGVHDAFMQWWQGANTRSFLLIMPFVGMMYYFLPKAAGTALYSRRLAITHFWAMVLLLPWTGPNHLHLTPVPEWASTTGMLSALILWLPCWGAMFNGLLTLRGVWPRVADDPVLKFLAAALMFYGVATLDDTLLAIKSVSAVAHFTDWPIANVHVTSMGWMGFMTCGMAYWLLPRLFQRPLWNPRLMKLHFWIAIAGVLLSIIPIYIAGVTQGVLSRTFTADGQLAYGFLDTLNRLMPYYWVRVVGGTLYLGGLAMLGANVLMTWRTRPVTYDEPVQQATALSATYIDPPLPPSRIRNVVAFGHTLDVIAQLHWHRRWERRPRRMVLVTLIALMLVAALQILPMFAWSSGMTSPDALRPYSVLELAGRDIYIAEGCHQCHSQVIRPLLADTERYGDPSRGGEFAYDRPFQWGSRRLGPDLARAGGGYRSPAWHLRHLDDPRATSPGSIMPRYSHLLETDLNFDTLAWNMRAMVLMGVPYRQDEIDNAARMARTRATAVFDEVMASHGEDVINPAWRDSRAIALIAYLQRLGATADAAEMGATP